MKSSSMIIMMVAGGYFLCTMLSSGSDDNSRTLSGSYRVIASVSDVLVRLVESYEQSNQETVTCRTFQTIVRHPTHSRFFYCSMRPRTSISTKGPLNSFVACFAAKTKNHFPFCRPQQSLQVHKKTAGHTYYMHTAFFEPVGILVA